MVIVGSPIARLEDLPLLTGTARFVADIDVPGAIEAAFVRSPHPHALIRRVETGAARALAGVHAVLTLEDLVPVMTERRMIRRSNSGSRLDRCWPFALANGEVSYVGEPVALVLADSRYVAEDAAALVEVDYEPLASVADCRQSADPGGVLVRRELASNIVASYRLGYGDADQAFRQAAHVFREELRQHRGAAHPIEGRGILAEYRRADGGLTVWASTQKAHDLFHTLAALLGLDEHSLRVATPDVGGGFGPKLCV